MNTTTTAFGSLKSCSATSLPLSSARVKLSIFLLSLSVDGVSAARAVVAAASRTAAARQRETVRRIDSSVSMRTLPGGGRGGDVGVGRYKDHTEGGDGEFQARVARRAVERAARLLPV